MALTLNGRKKKLKKQDFVAAMNTLKVEEKQQENIFNKMAKAMPISVNGGILSADPGKCSTQLSRHITLITDTIRTSSIRPITSGNTDPRQTKSKRNQW